MRARAISRTLTRGLIVGVALTAGAGTAVAAFTKSVSATATLSAYTVPAPTGLACQGLLNLTSSRIVWNAVPPPAGQTVDYLVTVPAGTTTAVSTTFYQLPAIVLAPGQYAVRTRISSGWTSAPSTITVSLNTLGILYICSTP